MARDMLKDVQELTVQMRDLAQHIAGAETPGATLCEGCPYKDECDGYDPKTKAPAAIQPSLPTMDPVQGELEKVAAHIIEVAIDLAPQRKELGEKLLDAASRLITIVAVS